MHWIIVIRVIFSIHDMWRLDEIKHVSTIHILFNVSWVFQVQGQYLLRDIPLSFSHKEGGYLFTITVWKTRERFVVTQCQKFVQTLGHSPCGMQIQV